jgi:lambda family phage portal protein
MAGKEQQFASTLALREIVKGRGTALAEAADKKFPPNIIDKVADKFSPAWAQKRTLNRYGNTILAGGYDVTQAGRGRKGRKNLNAAGNADNAQDDITLFNLRENVRDTDRNSPLMHGVIERACENISGPEYAFRPDSSDESFNRDAAALLEEHNKNAEHRGLFNFQDIIYYSTRALFTDGDILHNYLADETIQCLESHCLVSPIGGYGWNGRRVIGGVELDENGRHAAYYITDPKDNTYFQGWIGDYTKAQRIDASNATLIANRNRFSQTRGVPVLAPCMGYFGRLEGYLDAEMLAAEVDACKIFSIIRPDATTALPGVTTQTDPNSTADSETTYEKLLRSEPGMIFDLLSGERIEEHGGKRPSQAFEPYIVTTLRMIGCAVGFPLELILLDFSKTNYSSARASLLQAYRVFKCWQVFIRDWCIQRRYNWLMSKWIASGDLSPIANAYKLAFTPPRWAWVDPYKEVQSYIERIKAGAGTLTEWIEDEGKVMETVFDTRKKELALLIEKGIPSSTVESPKTPAPASGKTSSEDDENTERGKK